MDYENKFEIPLTAKNTENIFIVIKEYGKYIQSVYLPPHMDDGLSGRPFLYNYNKQDYYKLIERILEYKPVVLTYPLGEINVIEKYARIGIKRFMVSNWSNDYYKLKERFDIKIERSIVGNANNFVLDSRFDSIVLPYRLMLKKSEIIKISKQTDLIIIPNHICYIDCKYIDEHPLLSSEIDTECKGEDIKNYCYVLNKKENYKNVFIPREVLCELLPYIKTIKLVERLSKPEVYLNYLRYYALNKELEILSFNDKKNIKTIMKYKNSNLKGGECGFECVSCDKKCY